MRSERNRGRRAARLVLAAALALVCTGTPAARAEFFKLAGRYACLEKPGAVCDDAAPSGPGPFAPVPPVAAAPPAPAPVTVAPAPPPAPVAAMEKPAEPAPPQEPDGHAKAKPEKPKAPVDPLTAMGERLRAGRPAAGDLAELRAKAKAGNARALEMLAWCEMSGVGTPRDPVHAYLLYGEAAKAGAAAASATQRFIFRTRLTPDQRQQVLQVENGRLAAAGP